ncbi:hypothetical protein WA026_019136 [Henosepilachna vigintioctopunctata]|uniref:Reelin domain-containing protein n=1 Tax=Henosepilachna vigintioctopunctata TaxID=420089 RepID=A0AAW1V264_9CUCU
MFKLRVFTICTIVLCLIHGGNLECAKLPEGITSHSSTQDAVRYEIEISGNPETYVEGEQYTIYLRSTSSSNDDSNKFIRFILYVENSTWNGDPNIGTLQLFGDSLTKMSKDCPNMVVEADLQPKSEIQVLWLAPTMKTGCVSFKAIVVETMEIWFNEQGPLTKTICGEVEDEGDTQPSILRHCCACEEAKYEVTFEGLWSRNTHPKDFPPNG